MLPVTLFVAAVAYLPGMVSVTTTGRWAALAVGSAISVWQIRRPLIGTGHSLVIGLLAWSTLTLLWSASPIDTVGEMIHLGIMGLLFLVASQYHGDHEILLGALVMGLMPSLAVAFMQMQGDSGVVESTSSPSGLFLSRDTMGEIAACALVWTLARRAWPLVPAPLMLVLMSGSRGAWLACACGAAHWLWRTRLLRPWRLAGACALGLAAFVALGLYVRPTSGAERIDIWLLTLRNLTILGHGLGTFGTLAPLAEFVHDDPLQLVFEIGPGALCAGALLLLGLGRRCGPEGSALASILGASLVSFPTHHPMGASLVAVLAGLCHGARDRSIRAEHLLGVAGSVRFAYDHRGDASAHAGTSGPCGRAVAHGQKHQMESTEMDLHHEQSIQGA